MQVIGVGVFHLRCCFVFPFYWVLSSEFFDGLSQFIKTSSANSYMACNVGTKLCF